MLKTTVVWILVLGCLIAQLGCRPNATKDQGLKSEPAKPHELIRTYAKILYNGKTQGSGFFVEHQGVTSRTYFITARHVVTNLPQDFFRDEKLMLRLKKRDGNRSGIFEFEKTPELPFCIFHQADSVDVAVFPLGNFGELSNNEFDVRPIVFSESEPGFDWPHVLTGSDYGKYSIAPGSEVLVLGALASFEPNLTDQDEFLVTLRKGIVSFMPSCDLKLLEGGQARMFVLDCPVMNADSGGPVFALVSERRLGRSMGDKTPHLLGMTLSYLNDRIFSRVTTNGVAVKINDIAENSGLSFMLPADRIVEILKQIETVTLTNRVFSEAGQP